MRFGFALELSNVDLLNIDLLDTDIPSKYFACLHNVFKTSSRHVFKTSSRHVFKTSSRHLQDQHMFARSLWNKLYVGFYFVYLSDSSWKTDGKKFRENCVIFKIVQGKTAISPETPKCLNLEFHATTHLGM